jgi:hypothetical protein
VRIAAKVAADKEAHPERFCPAYRCLWRTDGSYCPRHDPPSPPPVKYEKPEKWSDEWIEEMDSPMWRDR